MLRRLLRRWAPGRRRADKVEKPPKDAKAPQISAIVAMALAHGVPYPYVDASLLDEAASDRSDASGATGGSTQDADEPQEPDAVD